jgi:hypothetical protein
MFSYLASRNSTTSLSKVVLSRAHSLVKIESHINCLLNDKTKIEVNYYPTKLVDYYFIKNPFHLFVFF